MPSPVLSGTMVPSVRANYPIYATQNPNGIDNQNIPFVLGRLIRDAFESAKRMSEGVLEKIYGHTGLRKPEPSKRKGKIELWMENPKRRSKRKREIELESFKCRSKRERHRERPVQDMDFCEIIQRAIDCRAEIRLAGDTGIMADEVFQITISPIRTKEDIESWELKDFSLELQRCENKSITISSISKKIVIMSYGDYHTPDSEGIHSFLQMIQSCIKRLRVSFDELSYLVVKKNDGKWVDYYNWAKNQNRENWAKNQNRENWAKNQNRELCMFEGSTTTEKPHQSTTLFINALTEEKDQQGHWKTIAITVSGIGIVIVSCSVATLCWIQQKIKPRKKNKERYEMPRLERHEMPCLV